MKDELGCVASLRPLFMLDPSIVHLNHGSFGACPIPVLESCQRWQRDIERRPSAIMSQEYGFNRLMAEVRAQLAAFVGARPDNLALCQNTTAGINAAARSIDLRPGDEVLTTDHEYEALELLWTEVCAAARARYVRRPIPLRVDSQAAVLESLWEGVTPQTRVIYLSHITSQTAVQLPLREVTARARAAGIITIVDGAHAPGQIPLELDELGADVYAASCHKWLCGPRGTGFLYARPEHHATIRGPLVSHGSRPGAGFEERNRWQGTRDPSPFLALPEAIRLHRSTDWARERQRCRELARTARASIADLFGLEPLTPDSLEWFSQMVAAPIPPADDHELRQQLFHRYRIDAPARTWQGQSLIRVSLQVYNTESDLDRLLDALRRELA